MKTKAVRVLNLLLEAEQVITYLIYISGIEHKENLLDVHNKVDLSIINHFKSKHILNLNSF